MKRRLFILLLLISGSIYSQKNKVYTFGKIKAEERALNIYSKDTTANAVFLFENGETVFKEGVNDIIISTK